MNHRAKPIADDWPTRRAFVPQGADQQGRQEPTIPVVIDRLPEDYDQTESADGQVLFWLLKGLIVVSTVLLCVWVIAGGLNA